MISAVMKKRKIFFKRKRVKQTGMSGLMISLVKFDDACKGMIAPGETGNI